MQASGNRSGGERAGGSPLALVLVGAGALVLTAGLGRWYLTDQGMPGVPAWRQALIAALALELVWLPLVGAMVPEYARQARARLGWVALGGGMAGLLLSAAFGLRLLALLQAQVLVLAFAGMVLEAGRLVSPSGLRPELARACVCVFTLVFVSLPWWSMPVLDLLPAGGGSEAWHHLATWFSPLALVGMPFPAFDLATTGSFYTIMRGPVVPYPPAAWMAAAAYGILAAGCSLLGRLCAGARWA